MNQSRLLCKLREPVNGLTHIVAALLAVGGLGLLLYLGRGSTNKLIVLGIYGLSLILMFSTSAAYHSIDAKPRTMDLLRKLDHLAIYLLIAGTYTPICLYYLPVAWRTSLLVTIWMLTAIGIAVKLFIINAPRWLTAGVYLLMGWLGAIAASDVLSLIPLGVLFWLITGGVFFTIGAVIYITGRPNPYPGRFGFHEIWHIFVILGAFSHFVIMAAYIAPLG